MKILNLPHKVCDYTCMINGLEDIYEWKTGVRLPDRLLFYLGGMSGFAYIQNKNANPPKMVFWGSSMKTMYESLSDVVGYEWKALESRTFSFTLQKARECIDRNFPVILGALDMFHLHYYEKFYHHVHIPIHYILMVGYNDDENVAYISDCGKKEIQSVQYSDLEKSLNISAPGLSKKNTLHAFKFNKELPDLKTIVEKGLRKRAELSLNPPVKFLGVPGIIKLASDFPEWKNQMTKLQYKKALMHFVEYTGGVVPILPSKLLKFPLDKNLDVHHANRKGFADLLYDLSMDNKIIQYQQASKLFYESGDIIEYITGKITDYLLGSINALVDIEHQLLKVASLEEEGYKIILKTYI